MNTSASYFSVTHRSIERISLLRTISALELAPDTDGSSKPGVISQLGPGTTVEPCGDGFDDRTVKVHALGRSYFVFLQDLESQSDGN